MLARLLLTLLFSTTLLAANPTSPLESKSKYVALVFISSECPISNKMVPEIERLHKNFAKKDVAVWIVYPNPSETEKDIKKHRREYHITTPFTLDPKHELTKKAAATTTPEAILYNEKREIIYRGRITDQFLALGKSRPAPTQFDLREAIESTLAGQPVKTPRTDPIGCFIQDLN